MFGLTRFSPGQGRVGFRLVDSWSNKLFLQRRITSVENVRVQFGPVRENFRSTCSGISLGKISIRSVRVWLFLPRLIHGDVAQLNYSFITVRRNNINKPSKKWILVFNVSFCRLVAYMQCQGNEVKSLKISFLQPYSRVFPFLGGGDVWLGFGGWPQ